MLDEGIALLDESFARHRQFYLTRLADALTRPGKQRDLDAAANWGIAAGAGSAQPAATVTRDEGQCLVVEIRTAEQRDVKALLVLIEDLDRFMAAPFDGWLRRTVVGEVHERITASLVVNGVSRPARLGFRHPYQGDLPHDADR